MHAMAVVVEVSMEEVEAQDEGWTAELEVVPVALSPEARQACAGLARYLRRHPDAMRHDNAGHMLRCEAEILWRDGAKCPGLVLEEVREALGVASLESWGEMMGTADVCLELEALAGVDL